LFLTGLYPAVPGERACSRASAAVAAAGDIEFRLAGMWPAAGENALIRIEARERGCILWR